MNPKSWQKQLMRGKNSIFETVPLLILVGQNLLYTPSCPRTCSDPAESVPQVLDYRRALSGLTERINFLHNFREFQSSLWRQHDRGALFQQCKHVTETSFRQASGMKEPGKFPCPSSSDPLLAWRPCLWNFPQHLWVASPDGEQGFATWACWKTFQPQSMIENLLYHVFPIVMLCFTRDPKPGSTHQRQNT